FGAVSQECVSQMLTGIQKMANSDYALAVSGIAGPTGGTKDKPVGTVYIGLLTPSTQEVFQCFFQGGREHIQEQSTAYAIARLAEVLDI
ncbi:MAG TPA: CinA family protein, partial [Sulfurovum sp.]|nr:CinA family protein [Sulfurovum sp.]